MRKTNEDLNLIHIIIKKHIDTIGDTDRPKQEKEIDYLLIKEAVMSLINQYKIADDSRQRKLIKKFLIDIDKKLFNYLLHINRYDHKILELYVMLEELVG